MLQRLSLCLLLASTAAIGLCFGAGPPVGDVTRTYDVRGLAARKILWWGMAGEKAMSVDGIDDIIRLLVSNVDPKGWRDRRWSIVEVNGTALEVRTTQANHELIGDLLAALYRLTDVQVVVEAGLYAVDRAYYEKELAPLFARNRSRPVALAVEVEEKLQKASRLARANKVRLSDGGRGQVFSLRRAVVYESQTGRWAAKTNEVGFAGVRLEVKARVTSDRRCVVMDVTQRGDELVVIGIRKTTIEGENVPMDVPNVRQSSSSATHSISVGDSIVMVIPPAAPLPGFEAKGPVPLLFVRPCVWIGEEEAERKRLKK